VLRRASMRGDLCRGRVAPGGAVPRPQTTRSPLSATEQRASVDRNLALELVRTTEYAALAAARWIGRRRNECARVPAARWSGRGEKEAADQAAVDAMRLMLDTVRMDGIVVIGEGEK